MAKYNLVRLSILLLVPLWMLTIVRHTTARVPPQTSTTKKAVSNHMLLMRVGIDLSKFENYQTRLVDVRSSKRTSPSGPDSQHH
ncbi:hypothetical protein Scep_011550 [Stephania cephalantha]|uniref:Uncharacterized protein n=1 Tax=Stephania cephalantha TaxID=152367 RepID=A0AAP0P5N6_9MAGN